MFNSSLLAIPLTGTKNILNHTSKERFAWKGFHCNIMYRTQRKIENIVNKKGKVEFEPIHKIKFHAVIKNHDVEKSVYKCDIKGRK